MFLPGLRARSLTRDAVRELDRRAIEEFAVPGIVLMENAGRGAAELLLSLGVSGRIVICCGKGNNGGDGFVMARHLDLRGQEVQVLLFCRFEDLRGDAAINYQIVANAGIPIEIHAGASLPDDALQSTFASSQWIVDAVFGTGLQGFVRPPFAQVIDLINASHCKVLAVDIPSGLDCDTGQPLGTAIRAMHTATFVAPKQGFLAAGAAAWTGQVHVLDIGAPRRLVEEVMCAPAKR